MGDVQSGTDGRGPSNPAPSRRRSGRRSGEDCPGPRSFGPPLVAVDGKSSLPVMASLAFGEARLGLVTRQGLTSYGQAVSAAWAPQDARAVNADYWTDFLSDDPDRDT